MKSHEKDIRSCEYRGQSLNNKNFSNACSGQKLLEKIKIVSLGILGCCLSSIVPFLSGGLLEIVWTTIKADYSVDLIKSVSITLYLTNLVCIGLLGWQVATAIASVVLMFIGAIIYITFEINSSNLGIGGVAVAQGFSMALAWGGAISIAFFMSLNDLCLGSVGKSLTLLGAVISTESIILLGLKFLNNPKAESGFIHSIAALVVILTASIIAQQVVKGSPKFAWLADEALLWAAKGGTSFYGVDLTDACFDGAHLPHTDFRKADLTRASFKDATGLELALLKDTILECPKIRKLLTSNKGQGEIYSGLSLKGANLKKADLQNSNFMEADLSGADLRGANLEGAILRGAKLNKANLKGANLDGANLVKVQALEANFSDTSLTGACIQDWSINENTDFNDVRGKYIYLKFGQHQPGEKQPSDREFQPGDLEKWIIKTYQAFNLIYRQKLELIAFVIALAQTAKEHEGVDVSHFSIEKNGNSILAKLGVFQGADTSAIPQTFINNYKDAVVIQGEEHNIVMNPNAKVKIVEKKKENHVGGDIVGGDKGDKTTVGNITAGDVTGSALVGDISGQVSVTIQQLKDVKAADSDELASILTALQEAIPGDSALSETQQRSALKAVETIAKEGKKPPKERDSDICSMALDALIGVTATVTNVSKLAELVEKYLPTLTQLLKISL
ncbi:pentapeptide repeat-containing protein [Microcoleus sp. C2D2]